MREASKLFETFGKNAEDQLTGFYQDIYVYIFDFEENLTHISLSISISIYVYIYILVTTSQLIFSVYYQRFRIVLRLHSSDIAKDDNQKSKSKTITSFSTKNEIAN